MKNIQDLEEKYRALENLAAEKENTDAAEILSRCRAALEDFRRDDCGCGETMRRQFILSMLRDVESKLH